MEPGWRETCAELLSSGDYAGAAELTGSVYRDAGLPAGLSALCQWEEIAYAMRAVASGDTHPSVAGIEAALRTAAAHPDLRERDRMALEARLMRHLCWNRPELHNPDADALIERARDLGDAEVLAYALFARHTGFKHTHDLAHAQAISAELASIAGAHPSPVLRAMAHWRRYIDCLISIDSAGADMSLGSLTQASQECNEAYWNVVTAICRAGQAAAEGSYDRAEAELATMRQFGRMFPGIVTAAYSTISIQVRRHRGRLGPDSPVSRTASGARALHPAFRIGLAYYLGITGRTIEARAELSGIDLDALSHDSGYLPCLAMCIELCLDHLNDAGLVESAYERLLPYRHLMVVTGPAQGTLGPAALFLGRAARTLGLPEAEGLLTEARDGAARMRMRPALSEALLHLGVLRQDQGAEDGPKLISDARAMAEVIGYAPVIAAGRAALRGPAERKRGQTTTELSPREREVLSLTAKGFTAGEVADMLVLSRRTVEKHLQHAYAKIGARNRAEGLNWAIVNGLTQDS